MLVIFHLELGIPSIRKSTTCIDYVPALCTHRPSLLPIELSDELQGASRNKRDDRQKCLFIVFVRHANCNKSYNLEEGEVVTRQP